jgi:cytoskeletal protein CcmA (bactofilin family)
MLVYQGVIRILSSGNVDGNIDAILMFITKNVCWFITGYVIGKSSINIYKRVYVMGKSSIYGNMTLEYIGYKYRLKSEVSQLSFYKVIH